MLPCLETPDPRQLTLPGKRLSAEIGAVADADLMIFFYFIFFIFFGRERYSLHECNDNNLKET